MLSAEIQDDTAKMSLESEALDHEFLSNRYRTTGMSFVLTCSTRYRTTGTWYRHVLCVRTLVGHRTNDTQCWPAMEQNDLQP